jgi:hypothetical protein
MYYKCVFAVILVVAAVMNCTLCLSDCDDLQSGFCCTIANGCSTNVDCVPVDVDGTTYNFQATSTTTYAVCVSISGFSNPAGFCDIDVDNDEQCASGNLYAVTDAHCTGRVLGTANYTSSTCCASSTSCYANT